MEVTIGEQYSLKEVVLSFKEEDEIFQQGTAEGAEENFIIKTEEIARAAGQTAPSRFSVRNVDNCMIATSTVFDWDEGYLHEMRKKLDEKTASTNASTIKEDNEDLCTMVLSAKNGEWETVFKILDNKPFLINCIPKERAWSALHQAVYQNNIQNVERLLQYKHCDVDVKGKRDVEGHAAAGDTPLEMAEKQGLKEIKVLLEKAKAKKMLLRELLPTYVSKYTGDEFIQDGIPYFLLAIAFMEEDVVRQLEMESCNSFHDITKSVYELIKKNWRYARNATAECLYTFDSMLYEELQNVKSGEEFFKTMITIYTSALIDRQLNKALLRASFELKPAGSDMMLALYALFLEATLLHWEDLKTYEGVAYRGMILTQQQLSNYKQDTTFVWMSFTSSTKIKEKARGFCMAVDNENIACLFKIDNKAKSKWSPKEIKSYSIFSKEEEVLYPAGAKFKVTKIRKAGFITKYMKINLELQRYDCID